MIWGASCFTGCVITERSERWRQFIASNGGGVQFHQGVLAAGEEKRYWRNKFVSYVVAVTPAINREREQVTTMQWKWLDTRRKTGRRRSPVCLSDSVAVSLVRRPEYFTGRTYPRLWSLHDFKCYPVDLVANHGGEGTNLRTTIVSGELNCAGSLIHFSLLYYRELHSVSLTE
jgi:hypothetical protein